MATADQIALSASHAAWAGAAASGCASAIALGIALLGWFRDERRRRQTATQQDQAFCFAVVGALEVIRPIILVVQERPAGEHDRRRFMSMVNHAHTIADAGLAIPVLEVQLLYDAYRLHGVLSYLKALPEDHPGAIPHAAVAETLDPALARLIEADDRFFARLPPLSRLKGAMAGRPIGVNRFTPSSTSKVDLA